MELVQTYVLIFIKLMIISNFLAFFSIVIFKFFPPGSGSRRDDADPRGSGSTALASNLVYTDLKESIKKKVVGPSVAAGPTGGSGQLRQLFPCGITPEHRIIESEYIRGKLSELFGTFHRQGGAVSSSLVILFLSHRVGISQRKSPKCFLSFWALFID